MAKLLKKILDLDGTELSVSFFGYTNTVGVVRYEVKKYPLKGKTPPQQAFITTDKLDMSGDIPRSTIQIFSSKTSAEISNDVKVRADARKAEKAKAKTDRPATTRSSTKKSSTAKDEGKAKKSIADIIAGLK